MFKRALEETTRKRAEKINSIYVILKNEKAQRKLFPNKKEA